LVAWPSRGSQSSHQRGGKQSPVGPGRKPILRGRRARKRLPSIRGEKMSSSLIGMVGVSQGQKTPISLIRRFGETARLVKAGTDDPKWVQNFGAAKLKGLERGSTHQLGAYPLRTCYDPAQNSPPHQTKNTPPFVGTDGSRPSAAGSGTMGVAWGEALCQPVAQAVTRSLIQKKGNPRKKRRLAPQATILLDEQTTADQRSGGGRLWLKPFGESGLDTGGGGTGRVQQDRPNPPSFGGGGSRPGLQKVTDQG